VTDILDDLETTVQTLRMLRDSGTRITAVVLAAVDDQGKMYHIFGHEDASLADMASLNLLMDLLKRDILRWWDAVQSDVEGGAP